MKTKVYFKSEAFIPFLPEESHINRGCYGAELACWISRQLALQGIVTSYPEYEDWGWFVEYATGEGNEYWLCCGNVAGTQNDWHIFLDPKGKGLLGRKKPGLEGVSSLMSALAEILEESDCVCSIEWFEEVSS